MVKLKYRDKIYNSEDVPLFLLFKKSSDKREFSTTLSNYKVGTFRPTENIFAVIAGNAVIKDKRSKLYFCIDKKEEKNMLTKCLYLDCDSDNNSMVCAPSDIPEHIIVKWIESNLGKINI